MASFGVFWELIPPDGYATATPTNKCASCDRKLGPVTLTFQFYIRSVKMNEHAKCMSSQVVWFNTYCSDTHTVQTDCSTRTAKAVGKNQNEIDFRRKSETGPALSSAALAEAGLSSARRLSRMMYGSDKTAGERSTTSAPRVSRCDFRVTDATDGYWFNDSVPISIAINFFARSSKTGTVTKRFDARLANRAFFVLAFGHSGAQPCAPECPKVNQN